MRVLVTGATGLLGRNLLPLLTASHDVYAITRRPPATSSQPNLTWVRQDLTAPLGELPERIDAVVHLAQSARYRDFPEGAEDVFAVNIHSTFRLLEYARRAGASAFVLGSTGGLYATSPDAVSESAPIALQDSYFRSKRIAELLLDNYADSFVGIRLRFFFVYGPGAARMLVPRLAARLLAGEEIVIDGDPGIRMNPVYAEDAAAAVSAALELTDPVAINVAGEETVSITELTTRLAAALGREARIRHAGDGPGDLVADTTRMRTLLGVSPGTTLSEGLEAVARSLRVQPSIATGEVHGG